MKAAVNKIKTSSMKQSCCNLEEKRRDYLEESIDLSQLVPNTPLSC